MRKPTLLRLSTLIAMAAVALSQTSADSSGNVDWGVHRGDAKGTQYSPLAQIHAANVHKLQPAWEYHTRDANQRSTMHVNPIVVNGVMYVTTPSMKAVALDAASGRELWSFDPAKHNNGTVIRLRNRGVAYWKGSEGERIFHFVRERVYGLDAKTGALIPSFGENGFIDLRKNLGVDPERAFIEMTSPGAIYKNFLIVGSRVNESYDASPGHIRAYDTVTGTFKWIFHTIPREGQPGHDTWQWVKGESYGGANAWGGVTVDEERGWVFCATGSATEDFYGGFRKGHNLFANSVLALDATTGERKWHYQTVHHDIWDYDNPTAPILVTLRTGNGSRDAVVQLTKMGFTFVLDRDTGTPLFPVHEMPVPRSNVPREETSPTQPYPIKPLPLVRQSLAEADLTNITPEARQFALKEFAKYIAGPMYTPPTSAGDADHTGSHGRIGMARRIVRPDAERAVRQRERRADHQPAQAGSRSARRQRTGSPPVGTRDLREDMCGLSRGGASGASTRDPFPPRPQEKPPGDRSGHRRRTQQHAGVPAVPSAGNERAHRLPDQRSSRGHERDATGHRRTVTRSTDTRFSPTSTAFRPSLHRGARSMRSIS